MKQTSVAEHHYSCCRDEFRDGSHPEDVSWFHSDFFLLVRPAIALCIDKRIIPHYCEGCSTYFPFPEVGFYFAVHPCGFGKVGYCVSKNCVQTDWCLRGRCFL